MDATTHDLTADDLIALSDTELAEAFVDLADALAVVDRDGKLVDALDGLLAETLERLSPEAGRAAVSRHWKDDRPDELLDAIASMRRRAAARALRDTFRGGALTPD